MGVFARLLRKDGPKSKGSEEASTAEAEAVAVTAEPGADAEDAAKGSEKAETETSSAATDSAESEESAAEGVEIPKQQSAEEAADSEAGEGARK
ncbi:hypothetical protein QF035_003228 [Streptomyces umbrinus]|uniref:Gliding motility protein n=1 Tax=Streptomyces umbrinus TaxID=67370 RepID=A0ABU0SSH8_9ACTN|nr:hypothetical protein [Streptomyces umbrinus]MDQ1025646.1 hypothetical protein [Streptomyces umbrinus]